MQYGHQFMTFVYFTICIALPERRSPFLSALLASKFSLLSSGEDALPFVFCFVAAIFFLRDVSISNDVVVTSEFAPFFSLENFFSVDYFSFVSLHWFSIFQTSFSSLFSSKKYYGNEAIFLYRIRRILTPFNMHNVDGIMILPLNVIMKLNDYMSIDYPYG